MFHFEEGEVFLIDKPLDWTSFDAVNLIRAVIKRYHGIRKIKVGHAGTLDPLATGLLVICTGRMTKQIDNFQAQEKVYTGTFLLGQTTPSYDMECEPDAFYPTDGITVEMMEEARKKFIGDILQRPPKFSAIKINGKRAFDYARSDKEIEMKERTVHIEDFKLDYSEFPKINFEVKCSKGTYIRSLAHDFGKALGNGASLISLRRTKIGDFDVTNARDLFELKREIQETGTEYREEVNSQNNETTDQQNKTPRYIR
ncbi:MAG: tRNA pseudouridine(55) synthase TruB [Bacteroidales bacterium]|nr:tRNA pseudouridine(55) synthase TruB [Bacteroidales bacterium]